MLYYAYSESTINPYLEGNSLPLKRRNWSNLAPEMLKHIVSDIEEECMNITQDHDSKEASFQCINVVR